MENELFVEVLFYSGKRKHLPAQGYRPDIIVDDIPDSYWGITFIELDVVEFDCNVPTIIRFTFQPYHYDEIEIGQTFRIMEGGNQVGEGTFISYRANNKPEISVDADEKE